MNRLRDDHPRQAGFSLLELTVATLLGMILAAGVVSVYAASKRDYARNAALESVQKSARSSLGAMAPLIRMAGFFGCGGMRPESILKTDLASYGAQQPMQGYEYLGTGMGSTFLIKAAVSEPGADGWSPSLPPDIGRAVGIDSAAPGSAIPGSDILLIHEAVSGAVRLVAPYTDGMDGLFVAAGQGAGLSIGELAVVSDCRHADLFQITDIGGGQAAGDLIAHSADAASSPGNTPPGRFSDDSYGPDSQLMRYETCLFYIGRGQDGGPSLYEVSMGTDAALSKRTELASGVENMQLLYGVDTDGDEIPNQYLTADQIADWGRVVSLRIALLARSTGAFTDIGDASAFKVLDAANGLTLKAPGDGHVRRLFEETISIRNRLP